MDCPNPLNPHTKTLPPNPENHITHKKTMEKFQNLIFKLAETHPNAPLTPSARTHLQDRLSRFVSQYKTPDHPPYSAMIERAILELNEKRGSSMDSISRFLEKEYDNLPWAHSTMLKHHLQNLCASSFIVMTRFKRYKLPGKIEIPILNSPSKEVNKSKPSRRKKRWRKGRPIKLRIQHKGKTVKVIEKHQEHDEKEERLTEENVGHMEQPERQQPEHTWPETSDSPGFEPSYPPGFDPANPPGFKLSNPPGFDPANPPGFDPANPPGFDPANPPGFEPSNPPGFEPSNPPGFEPSNPPGFELPQVENLPNPGAAEIPDEVSLHQQENDLSEIIKADVSAAHSQQQPEMQQSEYSQPEIPSFELPWVENLHNPGPSEIHSVVNLLHQDTGLLQITKADTSSAHTQEQLVGEKSVNSRPEISKSPNLKTPLAQLEPTSAEEQLDSERARRQLRRWNQSYPGSGDFNHLSLSGDFNLEKAQVSVVEKIQSENDVKSVKGVEKYSHRNKTEPKQPEFASSNEKSPSQQPRRSLRLRLASPKVTKDTDYTIMLPSQHYPISEPVSGDPCNSPSRVSSQQQENGPTDIIYSRRRKMKPEQSEIIVIDEKEPQKLPPQRKEVLQNMEQPRRSPRFRLSESEITVDVDYVIALPSQTGCENSLKSKPSKDNSDNQKRLPEPMKPMDEGTEVKKPTTTLPEKLPRQRKGFSQYKEQPRRSLRLRLSEPEIILDTNYVNVLPSQTCCEDNLKSEPSKEKAVNQK